MPSTFVELCGIPGSCGTDTDKKNLQKKNSKIHQKEPSPDETKENHKKLSARISW
jgi:hypothetical protein